ncbi:uncharacterized protein LOC135807904 [Sycon ciliatum]|uniref:uncharacterized protein LOC135807904 n=1 Tax=Sycon ciliatum TaxID=27933 RepID=UPI0031F62DF6
MSLLVAHPDALFRDYVCAGMFNGFSIGHTTPLVSCIQSVNHPSSLCNKQFVTLYLQSCCDAGETAGPFAEPPYQLFQTSGLGLIPKSNGKFRLIHDLSSPTGRSVNDGISRESFSLEYDTVDSAISYIMKLGRGCYLTKVDIRNAFRLCPVAPSDWHLLGISWDGRYYFEKVLPFGLRSAPYIFDKFASALHWVLEDTCRLPHLIHYLDDFLNVSPPSLPLAQHQKLLLLDLFAYLQVPVAPEKVDGPSTVLTFLGLELDTMALEIRLPPSKLTKLSTTVSALVQSGRVQKRDLASVLGKLSFASRAVPAGRTFLRRLYDLDRATRSTPLHQWLRISASAMADLLWWAEALTIWNGKSFFLVDEWTPAPDMQLQTDASGTHGYGAFYNGRWLRGEWTAQNENENIEFKEMYAIIVACATWGSEWSRRRIQFQCDNKAVVDCIRSGTCRSPPVMTLIRALYLLCIEHDFLVSAVHIPGVTNTVADALSRNLLQVFRHQAPEAAAEPDQPVLPTLR